MSSVIAIPIAELRHERKTWPSICVTDMSTMILNIIYQVSYLKIYT